VILKRFEIVYTTEIESENAFYAPLIKNLDACRLLVEESRLNEPVRRRDFNDSESESDDESDDGTDTVAVSTMTSSYKSMSRVDTMLGHHVKHVHVTKTDENMMRVADKRVRNQLDSRVRMTKIVVETFMPAITLLNLNLDVRMCCGIGISVFRFCLGVKYFTHYCYLLLCRIKTLCT